MSDSRAKRRSRVIDLVVAEMDRTEENYVPGDEVGFKSPSVEWYVADAARYLTRVAGQGKADLSDQRRMLVSIHATVTAMVSESWDLAVPEGFEFTKETALEVLTDPENHNVRIIGVRDRAIHDERDRDVDSIEFHGVEAPQ